MPKTFSTWRATAAVCLGLLTPGVGLLSPAQAQQEPQSPNSEFLDRLRPNHAKPLKELLACVETASGMGATVTADSFYQGGKITWDKNLIAADWFKQDQVSGTLGSEELFIKEGKDSSGARAGANVFLQRDHKGYFTFVSSDFVTRQNLVGLKGKGPFATTIITRLFHSGNQEVQFIQTAQSNLEGPNKNIIGLFRNGRLVGSEVLDNKSATDISSYWKSFKLMPATLEQMRPFQRCLTVYEKSGLH